MNKCKGKYFGNQAKDSADCVALVSAQFMGTAGEVVL
jgi:hypothetical protein